MFFSTHTVRTILSRGIRTLTTGQRNPLIFSEPFDGEKICSTQKSNLINMLLCHANALDALKNKKQHQSDEAFQAASNYLNEIPFDIIKCNINLTRVACEVLFGQIEQSVCSHADSLEKIIANYRRLVELSPKSPERERSRNLLFSEGFLSAEEAFPEFVTQPKKPAVAGEASPQSSCSPVNSVLEDDVKYDPFLRVILPDEGPRSSFSL